MFIVAFLFSSNFFLYKKSYFGEFPGGPGLGFCASIEGRTGSLPGPGAKILHGAAKKNKGLFSGKKKMDSVKLVHSFNSDENMKEHTLVLTKLWLESHLHYFMSVPEFHLSRTSILHT